MSESFHDHGLGVTIHTGFRKGTDAEAAKDIHGLIRGTPAEKARKREERERELAAEGEWWSDKLVARLWPDG